MGTNGERPDVEELERQATRTRAQLGETVGALGAKVDVPTRARGQVDAGREKARHAALRTRRAMTDGRGRPVPAVWIGAGTLGIATGLTILRRARR